MNEENRPAHRWRGFLAVVGSAWISAARGSGSRTAEDGMSTTGNTVRRRRRHYACGAAPLTVARRHRG